MSPLFTTHCMAARLGLPSSHRQHRYFEPVSHGIDRGAAEEVADHAVAVAAHDEHVDAALGGEADELAADVAVAEDAVHAADVAVEVAAEPRGELLDVQ